MKGKVVFTAMGNNWGRRHRRAMGVFVKPYKQAGWDVVWEKFSSAQVHAEVASAQHVYIWNGADLRSRHVLVTATNSPARVFCVEHGHFPQRGHLHVAEHGLYGRHPGLKADWDKLLTQADWDMFQARRRHLQEQWNPTRDVLVPLQVGRDVQVVKFGNGYTNDYLAALDLGPDKWIRHHPKNRFKHKAPNVDDRRNTMEVLQSYRRAYGINSTLLLEAALVGLDVTTLGQSYLDWSRNRDVAVAAILSCQIPRHAVNLKPWIRPCRGLEQLADL